jgi:hypothetical protein
MRILAAGLVVAGRDGNLSCGTALMAWSSHEGLFAGWVPASAAVAVHLPVRASIGAIAILAFGRLAFAGAVFARHFFLLLGTIRID